MSSTIHYAYQCDHNGYYIGESVRQHSPLEPGVLLVPAHAVLVPPPSIPAGKRAKWNGTGWNLEDIPAPPPWQVEEVPAPELVVPGSEEASEKPKKSKK